MKHQRSQDEIDRRMESVRGLLRRRHAEIEPDPTFAARVIAGLPSNEAWSFEWAVRRVLPVSVALAMVLTIAAAVTVGKARRTQSSASAAAQASPSSASGSRSDPLEWLLEDRRETR